MANFLKYSIGFDCSKDDFDACISLINTDQRVLIKSTRKCKNTAKGFIDAFEWVKKHCKEKVPVVITMEATGNYYEHLALYFTQEGYHVSVVLPNKSRKYMESKGYKSKNDRIDAKGLSQMGAEQVLSKWNPLSEQIYQLRLLTRHCEQLTNQRTQLLNQLESLEFGMHQNKLVEENLKQLVKLIEKQIKEAKVRIESIIKADAYLKERFDKIVVIKGLGLLTLATIIAETNKFELFENQSQLASYAGYDVVENQSGKRVGKTRISKKGNSHIRRALHMPALNMVRYGEPKFTALYERIYFRTKIKMKAYVAIQRKLLALIYTLWKKNEAYDASCTKTSGNEEPKQLFSLGFEKAVKQVVPIQNTGTTLDELPCNESPEALFSLLQNC